MVFIELIMTLLFYSYLFCILIKTFERTLGKLRKEKGGIDDINCLGKVIGLESVKKELGYYMDFIKNKEKYISWDINLPKGVLLIGPLRYID